MADRKNPMLTYFQRLQNAREKYSVLATKKKKKERWCLASWVVAYVYVPYRDKVRALPAFERSRGLNTTLTKLSSTT